MLPGEPFETMASAAAQKRLARSRMLFNVLSARFPATKLDDVRVMGLEWMEGMMESTFAAETTANKGVGGCCSRILVVLDHGAEWARLLVDAYREAGRLASQTSGGSSLERPAVTPPPLSKAEAAELLCKACAAGAMESIDSLPELAAAETEVRDRPANSWYPCVYLSERPAERSLLPPVCAGPRG